MKPVGVATTVAVVLASLTSVSTTPKKANSNAAQNYRKRGKYGKEAGVGESYSAKSTNVSA